MSIVEDLKSLTFSAAVGYAISWIYFFLSLGFFQTIFGKVQGGVVAYFSSWGVWMATTYFLEVY